MLIGEPPAFVPAAPATWPLPTNAVARIAMHVQAHSCHLDTIPNFHPILVRLPPGHAGTAPPRIGMSGTAYRIQHTVIKSCGPVKPLDMRPINPRISVRKVVLPGFPWV